MLTIDLLCAIQTQASGRIPLQTTQYEQVPAIITFPVAAAYIGVPAGAEMSTPLWKYGAPDGQSGLRG